MYNDLLTYLANKPEPYESNGLQFWDDAHISAEMLEAHLNPVTDSASRNHAFMKSSAQWIATLTGDAQGKHLLDLGCGPGLYAELFCQQGFDVHGVDISHRSIDYARQHADENGYAISYEQADYTKMSIENRYDCIVLLFCDFGVLPPADKRVLLAKVRKALIPGGTFVVDCFTPHEYRNFAWQRTIEYEEAGFWRDKPYTCIKTDVPYLQTHDYLEQYLIITAEACSCYNLWNHAFTDHELSTMLRDAGFESVAFFGDAAGSERTQDDTTLCAVAR